MTFKFRISTGLSFLSLFIASIAFISLLTATAIQKQLIQNKDWVGILVLLVAIIAMTSSPIILTINYFFEDRHKRIKIENNFLIIEQHNKKIILKKEDIKHFYNVKVNKHSILGGNGLKQLYEYFVIISKSNEFIYVTNLICKPEDFIECIGLEPEELYAFFPYIDKGIGKADNSVS